MSQFEHSASLDDAVDRVCAELVALIASVGAGPSADSVARVERAGRLMDAARVRVAAPFATEPGAAELLGYASPRAAVATLAQISERAAGERLVVAGATSSGVSVTGAMVPPAHPRLAEAVTAGSIGLDASALITRQLDSVAGRVTPEELSLAEDVMVNLATGHDPAGGQKLAPLSVDFISGAICHLIATIDPDGARPREQRANRRRSLRLGRQDTDGMFPISGRLLPEVGLQLLGMLEVARRSPRFREMFPEHAVLLSAEELATPTDSRTPEQRCHDAFAEMVIVAVDSDRAPRLDGAPVTVIVIAEARDLNDGGRDGDPIGVMAGSRFPVSRAEVERFIDAGGVRVVSKNDLGAVTGISSTQRCFTNAQRLAIAARDGYQCAAPGCSNNPHTLQAHHVVPDRDHGPTATESGILLCYWHHKEVDTGPWGYRMVNGLPEVRGPGIHDWVPLRLRITATKAA